MEDQRRNVDGVQVLTHIGLGGRLDGEIRGGETGEHILLPARMGQSLRDTAEPSRLARTAGLRICSHPYAPVTGRRLRSEQGDPARCSETAIR
jgi:hypothetical protein